MSLKLKFLGLGVLAVMATSAFGAMNASATSNGHFVSDLPVGHDQHLIVKGAESRKTGTHALAFHRLKANSHETTEDAPIICTQVDYHGTLSGAAATTSQSVQVRPKYQECQTLGGTSGHNVTVHVPETCGTNVFDFTSGGTGTVHVNCVIKITHPNCEITVDKQTVAGVTYTTEAGTNPHALTVSVDVKTIQGTFHSGLCIFLGTTHQFEMVGSVTVWGENTVGDRVGITHT